MSINKKRKKNITYLIIALIVITAAVAYTQIRKKSQMPEWRTENPSHGTIREVVTATGSLNPYVLVEVGTRHGPQGRSAGQAGHRDPPDRSGIRPGGRQQGDHLPRRSADGI